MPAVFLVFLAFFLSVPALSEPAPRVITSLGRIEPAGGVVRLAGPSGIGSVIMDLKVSAGEWVEEGQLIAILDTYAVRKADQARLQAELDNAKKKLARETKLSRAVASSAAAVENLELTVKAAEAAVSRSGRHGGAVDRAGPAKGPGARCACPAR